MDKKYLLLAIILLLAIGQVTAASLEDVYTRCEEEIDVDINNNTFTLDIPGQDEITLTCGQQLTRSYDIDFFQEGVAECQTDQIFSNFTGHFKTFTDKFDDFLDASSTGGYYEEYLVCSQDLASKSTSLETCQAKETQKDYKSEYDACEADKIVINGEKRQSETSLQTCNVAKNTCEQDLDKYKEQRIMYAIGGFLAGAAAFYFYNRKDRKVAQSPAQRQLPASR